MPHIPDELPKVSIKSDCKATNWAQMCQYLSVDSDERPTPLGAAELPA